MRSVLVLSIGLVISAATNAADVVASFTLPSKVKVRIVEAPFAQSGMVFDEKRPCFIEGRVPFGTDCGRPETYLKELTISYEGKTYQLDTSSIFNAWHGRPLVSLPPKGVKGRGLRYFGGYCANAESCMVRGLFSDGAGTFVAEWTISEGIAVRTVLTTSPDVKAAFVRHIDGVEP